MISSLDHHADFVPFYVGLTFLGGVNAWAVDSPRVGTRRPWAIGSALLWSFAAAWVAVLLVMSVTVWQASSPPPVPDQTFLGLPATLYRVIGLFGGAGLVLVATFAPQLGVGSTNDRAAG